MGYKKPMLFDAFKDKAKKDYPEKPKQTMLTPLTDKNARLGQIVVDRSRNNKRGMIVDPAEHYPNIIVDYVNLVVYYGVTSPFVLVKWMDSGGVTAETILRDGERNIARLYCVVSKPLNDKQKQKIGNLLDKLKSIGS